MMTPLFFCTLQVRHAPSVQTRPADGGDIFRRRVVLVRRPRALLVRVVARHSLPAQHLARRHCIHRVPRRRSLRLLQRQCRVSADAARVETLAGRVVRPLRSCVREFEVRPAEFLQGSVMIETATSPVATLLSNSKGFYTFVQRF